jgi:hypothetical protein
MSARFGPCLLVLSFRLLRAIGKLSFWRVVCLTVKPEGPVPQPLMPLLKSHNTFRGTIGTQYIDYWNPSTIAFVEVRIGGPDDKQARLLDTDRGGLWLMTEGVEAVGLAVTSQGFSVGRL